MITTTERVWYDFHTQLKHFIRKRVPDEHSAEDILQDIFLKVHTHMETLRDQDRLQSWLYQVARNAITDYYRLHKDTSVTSDLPELPVLPEDPLDDVVKELTPCIKTMIDRLPTDYRQALLLTEYQGLTQKELADRLGLSFSGAKSRVQRAREKLKQMLLDCCHFQFDLSGRIIDYQPKCCCCSTPNGCGVMS